MTKQIFESIRVSDFIVVGHEDPPRRTETIIDEVLDDEQVRKISAVWDGEVLDYGGGVKSIIAQDVIDSCENSTHKFSRKFGFTLKESKQILDALAEKIRTEEM